MNVFDKVGYSLKADVLGYDLRIAYKNIKFGIALFVDTAKSKKWRALKEFRHEKYPVDHEICIAINPYFKGRDKIALYGEQHFYELVKQVEMFLNK